MGQAEECQKKDIVETLQEKGEVEAVVDGVAKLLLEFSLDPERLEAPLARLGVRRVEASTPLPPITLVHIRVLARFLSSNVKVWFHFTWLVRIQ